MLLVQLSLPGAPLWVAPGGGVEEHESVDEALERELREEVGKVDLAEARWWSLDELDGATELLGPRALPRLLRDLLAVPDRPVLELTEL